MAIWPNPYADLLEMNRHDYESFRRLYLCEPTRGSGRTSFQLNRLRPPAIYVMLPREISHHGELFVSEWQRRHVRIISLYEMEQEWDRLIRGSLWTDFDVDHAVWEYVSMRWGYDREMKFKGRVHMICDLIQDRTKQRPSLLEGFRKFDDERAKAEAAVQAPRNTTRAS